MWYTGVGGRIMNVLKFNDTFDGLIEEPIGYWKTPEDIPQHIKNFVNEISNSLPLFDDTTNKYYCSNCIEELSREHKCPKCSRKFKLSNKLLIKGIDNIGYYTDHVYYYVFDLVGNNVLLYVLSEFIGYDKTVPYYLYKKSTIKIETAYQVFADEIVNIKTNKHITYKQLDEINTKFDFAGEDISNQEFQIYEEIELDWHENRYLYTNNLKDLKNTKLYEHSNIWTLGEYLNQNYFNLASLIYYPVYYKEFEYLVKLGFYSLAVRTCYLIKYKGSFEKTFGVMKKYSPFMKDIDITNEQLEALKLYSTTDVNLLNFIADNTRLFKVVTRHVSFDRVLKYLNDQGLTLDNFHEYGDYILCCQKFKLNMKDKDILFPDNFIEKHDKVAYEVIVTNNPETDNQIKLLSNILIFNQYEDDKYIIIPADGVDSLIDESTQQSNCVRTYCERICNNECQIYFMRKKTDIDKSFITIEVHNGKVVQARTKFNKLPSAEIMGIIKKWEKTLIPILNSEEE